MNREGSSTLTIRKSNWVTDGFKGYKATLFAGERAYVEINIPLRGGDDLFLHGNRDRSEERRVGKECRSRWSPYH